MEVRFALHLAKVGRDEYMFLPKLRSICLLSNEVQRVSRYIIHKYLPGETYLSIGLQHCRHSSYDPQGGLPFEEGEA